MVGVRQRPSPVLLVNPSFPHDERRAPPCHSGLPSGPMAARKGGTKCSIKVIGAGPVRDFPGTQTGTPCYLFVLYNVLLAT
jgi:hypothetical protein